MSFYVETVISNVDFQRTPWQYLRMLRIITHTLQHSAIKK